MRVPFPLFGRGLPTLNAWLQKFPKARFSGGKEQLLPPSSILYFSRDWFYLPNTPPHKATLPLAGFIAGILLVNDINPALAAHNTAIFVAGLKGFQ
jgi:hypothetical protein